MKIIISDAIHSLDSDSIGDNHYSGVSRYLDRDNIDDYLINDVRRSLERDNIGDHPYQ
jgi:hypothetical protein